MPGEDSGNEPYGHAWATNMRCYESWIESGDQKHDFAVITLDHDIGLQTGWFELYTSVPSNSIYLGGLNTAGYPSDLDSGDNLYWNYENGFDVNEYNHWHWLDTYGGQSGSPIWIFDGLNRYILSIHAYSGSGGSANYGTRINQVKYECIKNWLMVDTTLIEKPDLTVESTINSGFNTTLVRPGVTGFSAWSSIRNIGTIQSQSFEVSYFASTDNIITETDYLVGQEFISNLNPTESIDSEWTGIFPSDIPSGEYYIGWIVDLQGNINELNEDNNNNYIYSEKLHVDGTSPINPITCLQLNGSTESNIWQNVVNQPIFQWEGSNDIHTSVSGYYYYWGTIYDGTSPSFTIQSSFNSLNTNSGTYYLRLQTIDLLGNAAPWDTFYVFKYDDIPPTNPETCIQTNGTTEHDVWQISINDPCFDWSEGVDNHSGISGYYIYWGKDPEGTSDSFSQFSHYDPGIVNSGIHYLRIQTIDQIGNSNNWKTMYVFKYNSSSEENLDEKDPENNQNEISITHYILWLSLFSVGLSTTIYFMNKKFSFIRKGRVK